MIYLLCFCSFILPVISAKFSSFQDNEKIELFVNKVGPYNNPDETYQYYSLPLCQPDRVNFKSLSLGEALGGDRLAYSNYKINFKTDADNVELCSRSLSLNDVEKLVHAVEGKFYYEFYIDDLPIRGFIGDFEESNSIMLPHQHKTFLKTHQNFVFNYNKNQIVGVHVDSDNPVELHHDSTVADLKFTYTVKWVETTRTMEDREREQNKSKFFPRSLEVHWLSVINSTVLVLLLIGFVCIILMRILKNDLARYNQEDLGDDSGDFDDADVGWKMIHADVFRFPFAKNFLCSALGVGTQWLAIGGGLITMAAFDMFSVHKHGAMYSSAVLLYAITCFLAGYVATSLYIQMNGSRWVHNLIMTCFVFSVPMFVAWSVVNSFHWSYSSTQALPFGTCVLVAFIFFFIGMPLTVIGGVFGKNWVPPFDAPCRTKNIKREIPETNWYNSAFFHMCVGGFISFSSISVQLHYVFETVWGREQYFLYGILLLSFFLLLLVSGALGVTLTYFQLSAEDYRWWWRSILNVGSTGVFVFIYSIYYYSQKSPMTGVLQTVEYFTYTLVFCYIIFLSLGTVSFFASARFIKYIYRNLKMD